MMIDNYVRGVKNMAFTVTCLTLVQVTLLTSCNFGPHLQNDQIVMLDEKNILETMDTYNGVGKFFIEMESGYYLTADNRLTLYRSNDSWLILYGAVGYNVKEMVFTSFLTFLGPGFKNSNNSKSNLKQVDLCDFQNQMDIESNSSDPEITEYTATFNNQSYLIDKKDPLYKELITDSLEVVWPIMALRYPMAKGEPMPFLPKEIIDRYLQENLTEIMTIHKWRHQDYYERFEGGKKPSMQRDYKTIAKIIATGDSSLWVDPIDANNHYKFCSEAGSL